MTDRRKGCKNYLDLNRLRFQCENIRRLSWKGAILTSFLVICRVIKVMASRFSSGPPHKLSSIISSLLTQRQPGQVNSNPSSSLTTAAALWARHSQHLKNSQQRQERIEKDLQDQKDEKNEDGKDKNISNDAITSEEGRNTK